MEEENKEVEEEKKESVEEEKDTWEPKTKLGRLVKEGVIKDIDEILSKGYKILEPEIVDRLLPNLEVDLLLIGQAKGKFGGGKRRVFKQTQKKTAEGNKPKFSAAAVVGDRNGHVGIGFGKSKDTVPARDKAIKNAKLNIIKIRRGCGSWECGCKEPHSIPFKVSGKCGSVEITLLPAPKGKGLVAEKEIRKILEKAGIKDLWANAKGQTRKKRNLVMACFNALKQLSKVKISNPDYITQLGIVEGSIRKAEENEAQK